MIARAKAIQHCRMTGVKLVISKLDRLSRERCDRKVRHARRVGNVQVWLDAYGLDIAPGE